MAEIESEIERRARGLHAWETRIRTLEALDDLRARLAEVEALCDNRDPDRPIVHFIRAIRAAARGEGDR